MKKSILLLYLSALVLFAHANGTIHWITFFDTTTPGVTQVVDPNTHDILYNRWINVINAALAPKGYKGVTKDFYGYNTTPSNCRNAVANLQCDKNDIIVFYYVGHGGRSQHDKSNFPQMCLASNDENKFVPLEWVHNTLKTKGARLTLTIGMCCNSYDEGITPKEAPKFGKNNGNTYINNTNVKNIQKLFLENTGDLIISSSSAGETSAAIYDEFSGNLIKTDLGYTDYFSYFLIKLLEQYTSYDDGYKLDDYFKHISSTVLKVTNDDGHKQTPQYASNIRQVSPPVPIPIPTPQQNKSLEEIIDDYLSYIMDKNISLAKRNSEKQGFMKYFSQNAIVKIMSQDGDVVVDRESPDEFLGRIATSRLLLDVICDDFETDNNNKIKTLLIKEYYKGRK